jgi:uncharacterized membrane protein YfcA
LQDWRKVQLRSAGLLVVSTFLGIPLGLLLLKTAPEPLVKAILGVVIMAFSLDRLAGRRQVQLSDDRLAGFFGFGAGVLGGAYGMNGPPLVVYGTLRRWPPEVFRATLQGYFFPASLAGLAGYWLGGLMVPAVARYYLWSLPVVLVAVAMGSVVNRRMTAAAFVRYVHGGLIVIGSVLLFQAIAGLF